MRTNTPEQLQFEYNDFQGAIKELTTKIGELQSDAEEHNVVLATLKKTPKERKCFNMVGGVLMEKTVAEVEPALETKLTSIKGALETLAKELQKTHKELEDWKKKTGVKIVKTNQ
ncbi:hypothetical protein BABINDRAFT_41383 [Babjeviella inositovora NRRL Y-12698]|uniref:Prefoldin subunit 2 n=1 Tax=Babjeviella inositovora NRRL Y-12698 TaxID=984486 RepID=A0A1E3QKK7_9ASCO|nr:uncharacterized protein BABINDRAFT_41383 [Babjeviella inositovora NRRL Y-12698]ODQ77527.1 hypothetical protein BABINDRAFT_41383 [Babjeviella inositovora NRRL Y-12698]